jgi:hypothetical protein
LVTGSPPWFDKERNKIPSRGRKAASLAAAHGGKLPAMQNHEITTKLTPPNLFERLAGIGAAYLTTISDGARQVTGQGPTPQDAHEAAQSEWELAHQPNSAMMFP